MHDCSMHSLPSTDVLTHPHTSLGLYIAQSSFSFVGRTSAKGNAVEGSEHTVSHRGCTTDGSVSRAKLAQSQSALNCATRVCRIPDERLAFADIA